MKGRDCDNLQHGGHVSDRVALCIEKSAIMFSGSWWLHCMMHFHYYSFYIWKLKYAFPHSFNYSKFTRTLYEYLMPMRSGGKGPDGRVGWFSWWEISCLCAHTENILDLQNWNIQLDQSFTSNTVNDYYIPGMHIRCSIGKWKTITSLPHKFYFIASGCIPSPPYNRWASLNETWTSSHNSNY